MTSSVAVRRRSKARRIECCLASSREKTVICVGKPTSPVSSLRASTLPSEPVPPVTTTLLPVSIIPDLLVGSFVARHPLDHLRPGGRREARLASEPRAVEAAVADELAVRLDLRVEAEGGLDQSQQVELIYRLGGDVPDAAQVRVLGDYVADDVGERLRREAAENRAAESAHAPFALRKKPLDESVRAAKLAPDHRGAHRERVRVFDLAEPLRAPVDVFGVRRVRLRVVAAPPREDAVGREVYEPRARRRARLREPVREEIGRAHV